MISATCGGGSAGVRHGFLGRRGGVGTGDFASLNLSFRVGDETAAVEENRARVERWLAPLRLVLPKQVHGNRVVRVRAATTPPMEADATVTDCPGMALGILTADCVPLLLAGSSLARPVVAAVHAGWRGTAAGILSRALEAIEAHTGLRPPELRAWLGPAIGACCYEVGDEVIEALARVVPLPPGAVIEGAGNPRVDLRSIHASALARAGLPASKIEMVGPCTCCAADSFFSHRAGRGAPTGRQLSFIALTA